jgi:hypothetical protein
VILLASLGLAFALLPAVLYWRNTAHYRPPREIRDQLPSASVLIPARNESRSIRAAVESVLASEGVDFELIVLDDHSEDDTREIVARIASVDSRVRVESASPLPEGWCGKQHACFQLSKLAKHDVLVFLDADVRLTPDGLARMVGFLSDSKADLVSGFPRQETGTFLEKLLIPLIHFVLLGFLPIARMRSNPQPGLGAGCGQLFVARREGYEKVGGHSAVKKSLHDGVKLPRAFRAAGFKTDLADATDLATCRMYRSASEVWFGLAKNAREGLGAPGLLPFVTVLLLVGQVMPFGLLALSTFLGFDPLMSIICGIAVALTWYPRFDAAVRFRQSWLGAVLHPVGIVLLLAIQWYANFRAWFGKPSGWKGRAYPVRG